MMHNRYFPLIILIVLCQGLQAQDEPEGISLSAGYFGNFAIQPGLKVGAEFHFKQWTGSKKAGSSKSLFAGPEIGAFFRPGVSDNYLFNGEIGFKTRPRKIHSSFSAGLGYLLQSRITSSTVNLGSGDVSNDRETRHFFMPAAAYEFGGRFNPSLGWYFQFTIGGKFSGVAESEMVLFLEAGLKFFLGK